MKASLRVTLFLGLIPQLALAMIAPALVICSESDGGQVLELSTGDCCPATPPARDGLRGDDDCGGCSDAVLALSLQRDDDPRHLTSCSPPALPAAHLVPAALFRPVPATRAPPAPMAPPPLAALRTVHLRC